MNYSDQDSSRGRFVRVDDGHGRLVRDDDGYTRWVADPQPNVVKPSWLDEVIDPRLEQRMDTGIYKELSAWLHVRGGFDLKNALIAGSLMYAGWTYTEAGCMLIKNYGTNSVTLHPRSEITRSLLAWVASNNQSSSGTFSGISLPSFRHLEVEDNNTDYDWTEEEDQSYSRDPNYDSNDQPQKKVPPIKFRTSSGSSLFWFQHKLFLLERESTGNLNASDNEAIKLRVFWGSSEPLKSLLTHVQQQTLAKTEKLKMYKIGHQQLARNYSEHRKRLMKYIDMAPQQYEELMGDLQEYFDPESEEYYHSTGAPFRRGYLLYGPPGTGKTSLTQAIASEFNVPLYLVNLSNMTDQELDHAFTMLPHRCVVVFEDIDSMGIVRENKMKQKEPSNPQMQRTQREFTPSDSSDSWNCDDSEYYDSNQGYKEDEYEGARYGGETAQWQERDPMNHQVAHQQQNHGSRQKKTNQLKPEPKPEPKPKTLVTLSGLLNVIDGAGAKDGRLLIMTSNAPDSLDEALIRDGRIDMEIYMKKSDAIMAAITFKRCFGSDPRRKISNSELDRLSILFGEQIPDDAFATCEIQNYCMKYRGRPEKAVENFSHFIEQKKSGSKNIKYDMNRARKKIDFSSRPKEGWADELKHWQEKTQRQEETEKEDAGAEADIGSQDHEHQLRVGKDGKMHIVPKPASDSKRAARGVPAQLVSRDVPWSPVSDYFTPLNVITVVTVVSVAGAAWARTRRRN